MLKCGFLICTCFCCGACGCTAGITSLQGEKGVLGKPSALGQQLGTAGGVVGSQRYSRTAHLSHCLPAPCQAWPGTMRLWICIALLSAVLCASAERPAFVQRMIQGGKFVRDAVGGKLLLPGALPSATSSSSTGYISEWCSPQS